jgi:ATP synthase protein I
MADRMNRSDEERRRGRGSGSMADAARTIGALSTVGIAFVLAITIGAGLGWYLDKVFGTGPWLFFVFFAIGCAAGVLNVYRTAGRMLK